MASKLECSICTENFKIPRVLPCGHSFCEECLERWLKSSTSKPQSQTISGKQIQSNKLSCPECSDEHPLPAQGVKGFKKNFALAKAADNTPECQNCSTGREAIAKCLDCDGWLCMKCCDLHKQGLTKKHEIVSIHEANLRESSKEGIVTPQYKSCSCHNNKLIEYFCMKCRVACCQSGSLTQHKPHECVTLDERISDIGKEIQEILKAFTQVSSSLDQLENSWENRMKCKWPNTTEVGDQIMKLEKHLVDIVKTCAKKLLHEVQHSEAEYIKSYEKAKEEMNLIKIQMASSESDVRDWLKRRIPHEIYSQEEEMKQKVDQSVVIQNLPRPVWNMFSLDQPQVDTEAEISKLNKTVKHGKLASLRSINTRTPEDGKKCWLWDVAFLTDGNIAVSDHIIGNSKIKVFTTEGELVLQSKKGLFVNPCGVSPLPGDRDRLLVTDMKKHKVLSWNMRNQEVREFLTPGVKPVIYPSGLSITRSGDQDVVLVGDQEAGAVLYVDVNGHVLQQVKMEYNLGKNMWYIAGHPECQEIIGSDPYHKFIFAVRNGKMLWRVDMEVKDPKSVVLTGTGEVLVADWFSHRVVLMSREGQVVDTLLSADDGLNQPTGLAYSEQHHLLAVVEWESQLLKLFHY